MSAELIREAIALMRSRAARCAYVFGGEFRVDGDGPFSLYNGPQRLASGLDRSDAEHIASWHPVVALAVADWLEAALARDPRAQGTECETALAVARAYLGGVS